MLSLGGLLTGTVSKQTRTPSTILCQGILAILIAIVLFAFLSKDKLNKKSVEQLNKTEDIVMAKMKRRIVAR